MGYKSKFTGEQIDALLEKAGQGGGGSAPSAMEYVAFDSNTDLFTYGEIMGLFAYLIKYPTKIETLSIMIANKGEVNDAIAFAIDTKALIDFQGEKKTIKDWALSLGADLDLLPRLTEEEFYTL